jgi:HPt (histidine-containing phosphotransfer) domain-containing protein
MAELPPVIDPQGIENLRALNPDDHDEFLREIVTLFVEDTPQRLAELDRSLAAADAPTFVRAAHSIKGSSANLGALALRAAAEELEHRSAKQGLADVASLVVRVKAEFARTQTELERLIAAR